ncbi:MAG: NusG domain II-containing protein [Lachnospiraceae bacterium]|nr:NusG domain II-containing protein [Lachnospiraceae bacterium]
MSDRKLRDSENKPQRIWHSMRKADILLIIGCLLAALFLGIFFTVSRRTGNMVSISYDGMELCTIDLDERNGIDTVGQTQYYLILFTEKEAHITHHTDRPELPDDRSYNLITVVNGTVVMEAADCRDQICVHHRPIMSEQESIICLPHKLVAEILGGGKDTQTDPNQNKAGNSDKNIEEPLDGVVR